VNEIWNGILVKSEIRDYLESRQFGCCSSEVILKQRVSVIELPKAIFWFVSRYGQVMFQMLKVLDSILGFDELFQRMPTIYAVILYNINPLIAKWCQIAKTDHVDKLSNHVPSNHVHKMT
jgi:hypothetical protein